MTNQGRFFLVVGTAAVLGFTSPAHSSQFFDNQRGELAARVATQNTFQHNDAQSINWVQWRNEVRFDLRYDLIQQGMGQSFGPINSLRGNLLWRGRYDAVYQLRDSYKSRDYNRGNFELPEGETPRELLHVGPFCLRALRLSCPTYPMVGSRSNRRCRWDGRFLTRFAVGTGS